MSLKRQTLEQAIQQAYVAGYEKHLLRYERFGDRQVELARAQTILEVCMRFRKGDYGIATKGEMCKRVCEIITPYQLTYLRVKHPQALSKKLRLLNGGVITPPNLGNQHAVGKRKQLLG